jgi:CarD family transcriptional regulator
LFQKVPSKTASAKKLAVIQPADSPASAADEPIAAPAIVEPSVEAEPAAIAPAPLHAAPEVEQEKEAEPPAEKLAAPANDIAPPRHAPVPPRPMGQQMGGPRPPGGMQGGRIMPPPRAMAKAENFVEGDHVVYPTHGVGKVERIAIEEIAGHKLELIHITFEENRMTLRVPVAKARSAGLRKLASRKMFDEALAVLKGRARIKRTMWSRRAQEYEAKINSGDPLAIAEVVRDLHRNAGQPDQSFSERQIYEAAMDRLAAELGALERIDKVAAATKLAEFLKTV